MFLVPATPSITPQQSSPATPATAAQAATVSFNPFPVGRTQLILLAQAQTISNTPELDRAFEYYKKWQGAWQKGHPKPSAEELGQIEAFTNELLNKLPALAKTEGLKPYDIAPDFYATTKIGSPKFIAHSQTLGTQTLKALALMGLCEHELDIPLGGQIAIPLLPRLMGRTPFDPEVFLLYSRFSLDAGQNQSAWQSLLAGIYLEPNPSRENLEYTAFAGLICVKDQWARVQAMIRELAPTPELANEVIQEWKPRYEGNNAKTVIVPPSNTAK